MLKEELTRAVNILKSGGLVAFPTETVYGLGADAKNPTALKKIFHAKERPIDHPLIVHIGEIGQLSEWAVNITPWALQLAHAFWPGPLTLILPKAHGVLDLITGGQETVGIRIPHHPVALALLNQFGSALAAPSANRFGRISPTTKEAVLEELGSSVDMVLEGGQCEVGVESTIVDATGEKPQILRPGMITASQIEAVIQQAVSLKTKNAPRVSGSLESHYAPRTSTRILTSEQLITYLQQFPKTDLPRVVITRKPLKLPHENITCIMMPETAKEYAHDLYRTLRELDKKNYQEIIIEALPSDPEWIAICDRIERAQHK